MFFSSLSPTFFPRGQQCEIIQRDPCRLFSVTVPSFQVPGACSRWGWERWGAVSSLLWFLRLGLKASTNKTYVSYFTVF